MYAQRELTRLALRKNVLMHRIFARRKVCAEQIAEVTKPLVWLDGLRAKWSLVSPVAKVTAVPLALLLKKAFFPKARLLGSLIRWAPVAISIFRSVR